MGPYEEFKFANSLIGQIYPLSPQPKEEDKEIGSRGEAEQVLEGTVLSRGKFYYNFSEYTLTWLLQACCCCCINKESLAWRKRQHRYQNYVKAVEKLNDEVDILKHLANQRVSSFLAKLTLRKD